MLRGTSGPRRTSVHRTAVSYTFYIYWRVNFSENLILPPTLCFIIIFTRDLSLLVLLFSARGALTLHRIPPHSFCFSFITRPLSFTFVSSFVLILLSRLSTRLIYSLFHHLTLIALFLRVPRSRPDIHPPPT